MCVCARVCRSNLCCCVLRCDRDDAGVQHDADYVGCGRRLGSVASLTSPRADAFIALRKNLLAPSTPTIRDEFSLRYYAGYDNDLFAVRWAPSSSSSR